MPLANSALFYQLLGPYSTRADIVAYSANALSYVQNYERPLSDPQKKGEPYLWNFYGPTGNGQVDVASVGQYDAAGMEYAWYAMTGNETYLTRANTYATTYRDQYVIPNGYLIANYLAAPRGIALHYAATGDETSRTAIGGLAKMFAGSPTAGFLFGCGKHAAANDPDQRAWARTLESMIYAAAIGAPDVALSGGFGAGQGPWNYTTLATQAMNAILTGQFADGAWRSTESYLWISGTNPATAIFDFNTLVCQPFYSHLVWNALSDYHRLINADSRIWPAIERCATYHFESTAYGPSYTGPGSGGNDPAYATGIWKPVPTHEVCYYTEASKGYPNSGADPIIIKGSWFDWLNGFMIPAVARLYSVTGNPIWKTRADLLLSGMAHADFDGIAPKSFEEMYSWSWRAFPDLIGPAVNLKKIRLNWK